MKVEEILKGESKDLEFKEKLPEDSKKYMRMRTDPLIML